MLLRTTLLGVAIATLSTLSLAADERCPECRREAWRRANERAYQVGPRDYGHGSRGTPEDAHHYYLEGRTLARRGHWEAAADVLETAVRMAPQEGRYHLLLGKVLHRLFEPKSSLMHLKEAWKHGDDRVQEEAARLLASMGQPPSGPAPDNSARAVAEETSRGRAPRTESLYARLGGRKAVEAVVDQLLDRAGKNPKIAKFFMNMNMESAMLRDRLVAFVAQAAGGPEVYKGQSMKASHEGLGITNEQFDALVADLVASMDFLKVPKKEQGEVLALLGPTRADIVERR